MNLDSKIGISLYDQKYPLFNFCEWSETVIRLVKNDQFINYEDYLFRIEDYNAIRMSSYKSGKTTSQCLVQMRAHWGEYHKGRIFLPTEKANPEDSVDWNKVDKERLQWK